MHTLKVKDQSGLPVKGWSFGATKAVNLTSGQKPRHVRGWSLHSPDGQERFCEGNWEQFVPFANLIISNYGCTVNLS